MVLPSNCRFAVAFASEAETEQALRMGLSGRDVKVRRAKFSGAIRALASEPAARLVFVDIDGMDCPEAAAKELTAVLGFDTHLVAIGSTDTATFSRGLFRSGVTDYLVKPISPVLVQEAAKNLVEESEERSFAGRVVAFVGSAGCGTSPLVASIGRILASQDRTTSVVDLDTFGSNLSFTFEAEPPGGLSEFLDMLDLKGFKTTQSTHMESTIRSRQLDYLGVEVPENIFLYAYSLTSHIPKTPSPLSVIKLLEHVANRSHVVLTSGARDPDVQIEILRHADARVLIYEPTLSSVRAVARYLALLGPEFPVTLVQCHFRTRNSFLSSSHIRYALGERRPDVIVPFDSSFGVYVVGNTPTQPSRAYRKAVCRIIECVIERPAHVS